MSSSSAFCAAFRSAATMCFVPSMRRSSTLQPPVGVRGVCGVCVLAPRLTGAGCRRSEGWRRARLEAWCGCGCGCGCACRQHEQRVLATHAQQVLVDAWVLPRDVICGRGARARTVVGGGGETRRRACGAARCACGARAVRCACGAVRAHR